MPFDSRTFKDQTDFERLVLERLGERTVDLGDYKLIYQDELDPNKRGNIAVNMRAVHSGIALRDVLRKSLHPIGFVAAHKTLDLLIEQILRANGPAKERFWFSEKIEAIKSRPASLPAPFDTFPHLWDRLALLYDSLSELRHAFAHRRVEVLPTGDVAAYNNSGSTTDTMLSDEVGAFVAAVHIAAELVISADSVSRRFDLMAWHLNALSGRHGRRSLQVLDPSHGVALFVSDVAVMDDGLFQVDLARIREKAYNQEPRFWDLELRGNDSVYKGRLDDAPHQQAIEFSEFSPPDWLTRSPGN